MFTVILWLRQNKINIESPLTHLIFFNQVNEFKFKFNIKEVTRKAVEEYLKEKGDD